MVLVVSDAADVIDDLDRPVVEVGYHVAFKNFRPILVVAVRRAEDWYSLVPCNLADDRLKSNRMPHMAQSYRIDRLLRVVAQCVLAEATLSPFMMRWNGG